MTEKQAILRDLKVIAILNNKIDYSDHDNIGAVLELNPKSLFSTEYGQRYLDRIRAMYDGKEYEHTCILCGSPLDGANPVCDNCYKMITLGNAVAPKKPENVVSEETAPAAQTTEAVSETATESEVAQTVDTTSAGKESATNAEVESASSTEETVADTEAAPAEASESEAAQTGETTPAAETETASTETAPSAETEAASTETAPAEEAAPEAETASEEQASDDEDKSSDDIDLNHGSEGSVKGEKMLELSKALILLFVIMCFTIAIVCGVVLGIRNLRIKNQRQEQEQASSEAIIKDADLRDYYSMISSNVDYTYTIKADS
ncbi:MAG: hypothetical protein PUJ25_00920 [Lachnospiraceae bacterium]|nr:hypothetical protein [Lachnospiraceae bacterium]MDD7664152.1 hypothetical protein [Lachnospiraceae bacterium]MDY4164506.1 hypothetical protein [Lachnospiraceae bacterium]